MMFQQFLSSFVYQNQIVSVYISMYSDWKLEVDWVCGDLVNIIVDVVGCGVNFCEMVQVVSKCFDVFMGCVKIIVQIEQVGVLCQV